MSTTATWIVSYDLSTHHRSPRYRSHSSNLIPHHLSGILSSKHEHSMSNHGLLLSNIYRRGHNKRVSKMEIHATNDVQPGTSPPSGSSFPGWSNWILGAILSVLLPFIKNKWGPLQTLKNEVDTAIATAETVTETVEKLAEEVEKVAEEVAEKLPDDANLKKNIVAIENLAKVAVKEAEEVEAVINKVEKTEEQIEKILESGIDQGKEVNEVKEVNKKSD